MKLQAMVSYKQRRLEEARAEVLRAVDVFEKLGAAQFLESCKEFLRRIEEEMNNPVSSGQSDSDCELPRMVPLPARINFPL